MQQKKHKAGHLILLIIILLTVLLMLPHIIPFFFILVATEIAILALFAAAFNLLLGSGGMLSFGHAASFALGAYGSALLFKKAGVPMVLTVAAGPLFAAAGALLFGFFIVRLTTVYFAMLSLAFAQIVYTIIFKWYGFTGGDNGLLGIWPTSFLKSPVAYYYFTMAVVGLSVLALYAIINSPFGYALKAIRENPRRARFIGVNVKRHQHMAFVLSGFFSGIAGSLFAFFNGSVFPDYAFFNKSFEPLIVVIMGGTQFFLGPLVGAVGYKLLETFISGRWPVYWPLFMGSIVIAVILVSPQGFMGFLERLLWGRKLRSRA